MRQIGSLYFSSNTSRENVLGNGRMMPLHMHINPWPLSYGDLINLFLIFPGGVCVLTSRNSQHRPLPAISQECAKRQAVRCRSLRELSDEHHRRTEYRKDWQGVQLGRDWTSLVESINGQRKRWIYSPLSVMLNLSAPSRLCNKLDFTLKSHQKWR